MGYYLRILTPAPSCISGSGIRDALRASPELELALDGPDNQWSNGVVGLKGEPEDSAVLELERNGVAPGSLAEAELQEFVEELAEARPASGAAWVREYLKSVRTIYLVRLLFLADEHVEAVDRVIEAIRVSAGGILKADGEGFTNEDGGCVVWQFPPAVSGAWSMSVLDAKGAWLSFQMDLGDSSHREAFLRGAVPLGVCATRP